jgi:AraC-like DNA-binding protein
MTSPLTSNHSFASIEQLDEVTHALGWCTEYRQLKPGSFWSSFTVQEGESWFLMEEQTSCTVEVEAPAPEGMYVLGLTEGDPGAINGLQTSNDHLIVQGPYSEFLATLPAGMKIPQIGITAELFEDISHSIAPEMQVARTNAYTLAVAPGRLASIRQAMRAVLFTPSKSLTAREEAVSRLLADIVTIMSDYNQVSIGHSLHRAAAMRALERAREYIEAHLGEAIRIESLCRYANIPLRSLERTFAREMGVTPQQYVKARRLNAIRKCLLVEDCEQWPSVTEVALRHGITHLGRFAGEYHRYFGETPRETLRNNRLDLPPSQHWA